MTLISDSPQIEFYSHRVLAGQVLNGRLTRFLMNRRTSLQYALMSAWTAPVIAGAVQLDKLDVAADVLAARVVQKRRSAIAGRPRSETVRSGRTLIDQAESQRP